MDVTGTKSIKDLPGPGNYDGNMNLMGKDLKKVTLGAKPKRVDDTLGPGPGGYNSDPDRIKSGFHSYRIGSE